MYIFNYPPPLFEEIKIKEYPVFLLFIEIESGREERNSTGLENYNHAVEQNFFLL